MSYPNEFLNLQTAVLNRLTATDAAVPPPSPNASSVTWIAEVLGDLANRVAQAIANAGIMGLVITPGGKSSRMFNAETGQISMGCPVLIQIQENVILNQASTGTKIHALDLVKFCMKRLNFFDPQRTGASDRGRRSPDRIQLDPMPFELIAYPDGKSPLLVYDVRFIAPITLQ
jgi:hypothetical protein